MFDHGLAECHKTNDKIKVYFGGAPPNPKTASAPARFFRIHALKADSDKYGFKVKTLLTKLRDFNADGEQWFIQPGP